MANPIAAVELLDTLHQLNQRVGEAMQDQPEPEQQPHPEPPAPAESPAPAATKPTDPSPDPEDSHSPKSESEQDSDGDADDTPAATAEPADAESGAGTDTGRFSEPSPDTDAEQVGEPEPADPEADTDPGGLDLGAAHDLVPAAFRKTPEAWRLDWPRLLPSIRCYLHIHQDHLDGESAHGDAGLDGLDRRWPGPVARTEHGPITHHYVREHLAPYHRFTITPVLDPVGQMLSCASLPFLPTPRLGTDGKEAQLNTPTPRTPAPVRTAPTSTTQSPTSAATPGDRARRDSPGSGTTGCCVGSPTG
ncbi:MAG TPA: hypothetical protein VFJ19_04660 [Nocardioidaceae bacterium]|nr:hypothetical protein [Nocardioidaceae bacterium]